MGYLNKVGLVAAIFSFVGFLALPSYVLAQVGSGNSCANAHELMPGACGSSLFIETGLVDPTGFGNPDGGTGSCWGAGSGDVVWYQFIATATSHFVDAECYNGTSTDVMMAGFTGTCGSLAEIDCSDDGKSGPCPVSGLTLAGLTIGTTYYIAVDAADGSTPGICLEGADPAPPTNDDCANAITVSQGVVVPTNNVNATADKDLCAGSTENNIWYTWTAPCSWPAGDSIFVHLFNQNCAAPNGMQLSVFAAADCGAIPEPAGAGDCVAASSTQTDANIFFEWEPTACTTYFFDLDGFGGTQCIFDFMVSGNSCLTLTSTSFTAASCGGTDGTATVTAKNNTSTPYTFFWSTGGTGTHASYDTETALAAGSYTVSIVDASGCAIIDTVVVKGPVDAIWSSAGDSCLATNSISFEHSGTDDECSSGCPTHWWDFGDGTATSSAEDPTHSYGTAGTFTVIHAVDDGSCTDTVTLTVTIINCTCALIVNAGADTTICLNNTTTLLNGSYTTETCAGSGGTGSASEGGSLEFCYGTFYDPQGPGANYTEDVYGSFPTGYYKFGAGTTGSVKVCFDVLDLNTASCMGNTDEIRVYNGAGTLNAQFTQTTSSGFNGATVSGNCVTVTTTDGYAYIRFLTWCTPATSFEGWTATYTTVDGSGNCVCPGGCGATACPTVAWSPATYLSATDTLNPTISAP
ncbi:MAG: hypothetical protein COC01_04555, partial [Bacteroidetes bacterium]